MLVPKAEELVAIPYRFDGDSGRAKDFFEAGMLETCSQLWKYSSDEYPISIYYAYKQSETREEKDTKSKRRYPDIVTIDLFCRMLGGIGDGTARKLLRGNHVEHFYIRNTYFIPKVSIIDYLLSSDYETYKTKLKHKADT